MLDIKYIRGNLDEVQQNAANKNIEVDVKQLLALDEQRRSLTVEIDKIRAKRNELSGSIGAGNKPSAEDISRSKELKQQLQELESKLDPIEVEFDALHRAVPNMSSEDTPVGASEEQNEVVYEKGEKPSFDFEAKDHWVIAQERDWIDKERAAKVSGARFAYIKGDLVRLQFALMQYVLDVVTDEETLGKIIKEAGLSVTSKPFVPVIPPYMIRTEMFDGMDRLEPREDRYKIEGEELWLQGSAEHVLGSMHADETISSDDLPLRYLGYATSFRKEAGTYGKDMEGIIRMHQFDKLEMEIIAHPDSGMDEHMLTIAIQEHLLNELKLPYRKLLKCTADIGKPNFRGVDMDVWLPGQGKYRETHTADFMTDYQSRRLNTKVKTDNSTVLIHTVDATALALGRGMVAIIENNQTKDGKVNVPKVLQKYMGGVEQL